jgi:hypothetical protein
MITGSAQYFRHALVWHLNRGSAGRDIQPDLMQEAKLRAVDRVFERMNSDFKAGYKLLNPFYFEDQETGYSFEIAICAGNPKNYSQVARKKRSSSDTNNDSE